MEGAFALDLARDEPLPFSALPAFSARHVPSGRGEGILNTVPNSGIRRQFLAVPRYQYVMLFSPSWCDCCSLRAGEASEKSLRGEHTCNRSGFPR